MTKNRSCKSLYFYIPDRYVDSVKLQITFRALSYSELHATLSILEEDRGGLFAYQICKLAIIDIETDTGTSLKVNQLPPVFMKEVSDKILSVSSVTQEEFKKLNTSIHISFDSQFSTDTWDCEVCKRKKLDRVRNCGYRGEKNKNKDFSILVGGQLFKHCPIYDVDKELLSDALECYNMYDKNMFPDAGGLYDQTKFFVVSSALVSNKVKSEELKELKRQQKRKNNK